MEKPRSSRQKWNERSPSRIHMERFGISKEIAMRLTNLESAQDKVHRMERAGATQGQHLNNYCNSYTYVEQTKEWLDKLVAKGVMPKYKIEGSEFIFDDRIE